MENGKTGLFEAIDMAPHIELRVDSPNRPGRNKISRRGTCYQSSQFVRNNCGNSGKNVLCKALLYFVRLKKISRGTI